MAKIKKILVLLPITFCLTGCDVASALPDIGEKLVPSWLSFVVQILALAVLMVVVIFVAYKPVKELLRKRADFIEKNIKDSVNNKIQSEKNLEESNQTIISSQEKANEIIEKANIAGNAIKYQIIQEAEADAKRIKMDAEKDIEQSKQEAVDEIRNEIVNVALAASSEILKREIDENDNKRLTKDFIEKL